MTKTKKPLVGIVGGMGPSATVYLQQLILQFASSKNDQGHIPFLLFMNPQILSCQEDGGNYIKEVYRSIKVLEHAGATHIVLACYSAYIGIEEIQSKINVKLIDIPLLTINWISQNFSEKKIGLLAAPKVLKAKLFQAPLESFGYKIIIPSAVIQNKYVEKAIYDPNFGIKSGNIEESNKMILHAMKHLVSRGAEKIIFGCTDLPVAYSTDDQGIIDPLRILAKYIVKLSKG